jgi:prepilin-type N-terminal cleavage/methylation domain-containing protein
MRANDRSNERRRPRGFTLLEMLVVVALVVLMMTILASIFQAATGAMSASRTYQELDDSLRLLDMTIRQDLTGVTARLTPPLDPALKLGYFEYGENAPADLQGEDTDDYLAFTTKAPEGQFFTGRVWLPINTTGTLNTPANGAVLPITVTSNFAEVIYFLRHGNLYRRVLLIKPELVGQLAQSGTANPGLFVPTLSNGVLVSWMAVNDISVHPSDLPLTSSFPSALTPIPNDLGDLTDRQNRYGRPRFANDYVNNLSANPVRDQIADDGNGDGIPDYWPTLTANQVNAAFTATTTVGVAPSSLLNEDGSSRPGANGGYARVGSTTDIFAFPFMYPGMYSHPETASIDGGANPPMGWLHALDTRLIGGTLPLATNNGIYLNHSPLEFGDSLPTPTTGAQRTTWWGFPTWRETASAGWLDPVFSLTHSQVGIGQQPFGLQSTNPSVPPATGNPNLLPPLGSMPPLGFPTPLLTPGVTPPPSYPFPPGVVTPFDSDGVGSYHFTTTQLTPPPANTFLNPTVLWEDDLIMTGVRSFDVKAFDPNASVYNYANLVSPTNAIPANAPFYTPGYYDLGYAATDYYTTLGNEGLITGTPAFYTNPATTPNALFDANFNPQGMGHEGRMPPNVNDNRVDPQRPFNNNVNGFPANVNFVGDNTLGQPRMRRVWDTWSTTYTQAPSMDVNLRGSTLQPWPFDRPIYPSYPPPYPQPLRGIQIQIRVSDAKNERVKILTIRQDFSDKL